MIVAASFVINLWQTLHDQNAAFYLPLSRFWELLAGAMLVYRRDPQVPWTGRQYWAGIGLLLIVASVAYIHPDTGFPGWRAVFPVAGTVLLIGSGPNTWVHRVVLFNRLLVGIGLISYPLYLWHWVFLSFIHIEADYPGWQLRLGGVAASFVLAWVTFAGVEKHLRHSRKPVVVWSLVAGLAGLGVLSLGVIRYDRRILRPNV